MPRSLVQRTFPDAVHVPISEAGAAACLNGVARNADVRVTRVQSYVSADRMRTYCLYDGPDPETIRKAAERNELPVDVITQVSVLDPDFCR